MAFREKKARKRYVKMCIYGGPGVGKTFTALLLAEGLAAKSGKEIAFVDTENGSDFYVLKAERRRVHPDGFAFKAEETREFYRAKESIEECDPDQFGVLIVDSVSQLWEACQDAYTGKRQKDGGLPFGAWQKVKKPWRELVAAMLNGQFHVICLGRESRVYEDDRRSGQKVVTGYKMACEQEAEHEFDISCRMFLGPKGENVLHVIKDRTSQLTGQYIEYPTFEKVCEPLLSMLHSDEHGKVQTPDEQRVADSEAAADELSANEAHSDSVLRRFRAKFEAADTEEEVEGVAGELKKLKSSLPSSVLKDLRQSWSSSLERVRGQR